ncbi:HAD family hydrolase [Candidatus Microgenomates bacterium]|nr:HAD family hydrolase [Candidatus Microgenomates bacterium]
MIKAVIFDIDGVLLDSFEANLKFYQDLMIKAGYPPPTREEYPSFFHFSMFDVIKTLTRLKSKEKIQRIWDMGKNREVKYPVELLNTPKGAEKVIKELSKNYRLGIVTSRIRNGIYESPHLQKLKKYFKVSVSYEDTVNHKPHPEPLLLAAQKLGVKPMESVYVGDTETDIRAAKAAGMKVVIYSQNQPPGADAYIFSFKDLPQQIAKLFPLIN